MNKNFKDFDIKPVIKGFIGEKVNVNRLLNREIKIIDYKVKDSKYKDVDNYDKCLHLQIFFENKIHVVFIGSATLVEMIERVPKEDGFPFFTTIIKTDDRRYVFT